MKVSVSFLKSKYNLETTIRKINETNADFLHVDVMDGKFVPNISCVYEEVSDTIKMSNKLLDVHLMVSDPEEYILKYKNLNPYMITIHFEIDKDIKELIDLIHSYGIKAGISIKPNTSVMEIEYILDDIDNVLVMSVEPGKGGQKFIESSKEKVDLLYSLKNDSDYLISVDGGINNDTVSKVNNADIVITGSYICMSDNYQENINKIKGIYE